MLLVLWAALVPSLLGLREVMPPDEPRFTHQAQEMKEGGDWIVPRIAGVPSPDKPPLLFWAINLASLFLPRVNEFTARIPSALASLAVLLLTVRLGRRLFASEEIGVGGALVLLTGIEFFQKTEWVSCDMPLTAGVLVALTCFREAAFEDGRMPFWGWCGAAAAVLTKGPVGLAWPLLWIVSEAVARRRWRPVLRILHPAGIAAFTLLAGGWYGAFGVRAGGSNLYNALFTQNVTRYLSAWNAIGPWYFYFYQLPADLLPWSLFLPAVAALVVAHVRSRGGEGDPVAVRAAAVFVMAALAFFSGSTGKRGVYLLPLFPVVALLLAAAFLGAGRPGALRAVWRSAGLAGMAALGVGVGLGVPLAARSGSLATLAGNLNGWEAAAFLVGGVALAAGALAALRLARRGQTGAALRSAAAGAAVLLFVGGTAGGAAANRHQNAREFGRRVGSLVPAGERIAIERGKFELILFYSRRRGTEFGTEWQLQEALGSGGCRYAILNEKGYRQLHQAEPVREMPLLFTARVGESTLHLLGPRPDPPGAPGPRAP